MALAAIAAASCAAASPGPRKKIALIGTAMKKLYHAQHFMDRLVVGYGWQGQRHHPAVGIWPDFISTNSPRATSPGNGRGVNRVTMYPTVAVKRSHWAAQNLPVDGVVIIGEHGEYPLDNEGRVHYPRYKWFKEVVKVFGKTAAGRCRSTMTASIFPPTGARPLKWCWTRAGLASRSSPAPPSPSPGVNRNWNGRSDRNWPKALPSASAGLTPTIFTAWKRPGCMSERRAGGEVGVKSVLGVKGDRAWEVLAGRDATRELLFSALARSHSLAPPAGYTVIAPDFDRLRRRSPNIEAFFIEHLDGFQTAMLMLNGYFIAPDADAPAREAAREVQDFTYAGRLHSGRISSCRMHLSFPGERATLADFFNPMVNRIEQMVLTGRTPYQIERTLLTTGMLTFGIDSIFRGVRMATPGTEGGLSTAG